MIKRLSTKLFPDPKRTILQFFELNELRTKRIVRMISSLEENEVKKILNGVFDSFSKRHNEFEEIIFSNYLRVEKFVHNAGRISRYRKLLIGSYFSKEYSVSAAALFNPSIIEHPDQSGIERDSLRFIMSLRATGEGHISSIEFREGIIDKNSNVNMKNPGRFLSVPRKESINSKDIALKYGTVSPSEKKDLFNSNYKCSFPGDVSINERILFPLSKSESGGMEDARFVKFFDGKDFKYFGTYTAYDGRNLRTQLIETKDFQNFEISMLKGNAIRDKGMAIFPRKINNKYVITSRQDGENMFIMNSNSIYNWNRAKKLLSPEQFWQFIQIGNCGSPVETDAGWILITHAVGPIRRYVISALLLDLENPSKIIGQLKEPLIQPNDDEREGYVPNVVYSCGSIIHKNNLIVPYAFSDSNCGFARIGINELINKLTMA